MALTFHAADDCFWTSGEIEYPLLWIILAVTFGVTGGGRHSVVHLIRKEF